MSNNTLIVVIALLAVGTYGLRLGGVLLARRMPGSSAAGDSAAPSGDGSSAAPSGDGSSAAPSGDGSSAAPSGDGRAPATDAGPKAGVGATVARLLPYAAVALLSALAATSAFIESGDFAGFARPAGVVAGLVAGLLRAPFAVAVVLAAAVAAGLRLLGVP